jgi:putative redox protein
MYQEETVTSPRNEQLANSDADNGGGWVTTHVGSRGFRAEISSGEHVLVADEPLAAGGTDEGPTPYELLLAALGACTAMTLRMYADRKKWPLEDVRVRLRSSRSHARDCENCEKEAVGIHRIERKLELSGSLTDEQRQRLQEIADRCPVKQTIQREIRVESVP